MDARKRQIKNIKHYYNKTASLPCSGKWNLIKYAKLEAGNWKLAASNEKELNLIIKNLQLIVSHGETILESFSLTKSFQTVKSVYNNATLVVAVKCQDKSTKFRVLFSSEFEGERCALELRKYIDVIISQGSRTAIDTSQQPLPLAMAELLHRQDPPFPVPESIPYEYPLEDAITICVLDPGFPKLVERVESTLININSPPKIQY